MWHRISAVRRLTGGRRTLESQLSASDRSSIWVGHFESELKKCFILQLFQLNGTIEEESKQVDFDGPDSIIEFHACKKI